MCTHDLCFEQNYENSQRFSNENVLFTPLKNRCMLHGRVFVMTGPKKPVCEPSPLSAHEITNT